MKKNIFALAAAALFAFGMTACTEEPINPINPGEGTEVNTPMVKSAADLIGTEWEYVLDLTAGMDTDLLACMDSATIADMLTMTFGLNFDSSYAHLTFPEDVIGLNVIEDGDDFTIEEVQEMAYAYTYDASTTSGTLTGSNLGTLVLPFTYDEANDIITISMMVASEDDEDNAVPFNLVFNRVN
ncbi:MAG: hypothetical protein IJ524_05395 [Bacteroidales bacterium]|nr:hypothetical protein [Bacteroidales bacterium]